MTSRRTAVGMVVVGVLLVVGGLTLTFAVETTMSPSVGWLVTTLGAVLLVLGLITRARSRRDTVRT